MKTEPANEAGATVVIAKWFAETPNGWIASHDKAALQVLAARLDAAEQMAQAMDALIGLAVLCQQCPDSWQLCVNAARTARAAWEAAK